MDGDTVWQFIGALAFGAVVGWTTYFILRRAQPKALSDITTFIGTIGGATIIGLFSPEGATFAGYAIGLAAGFFGYYLIFLKVVGKHAIREAIIKHMTKSEGIAMGVPPGAEAEEQATTVDWGEDRAAKKP